MSERIKRATDNFDRISDGTKNIQYRNALSFFVYFTMLFNGGLVPQYIMWTTFFHIKDTYAALIFPNLLMTAFNIFLVRNYYSNSLRKHYTKLRSWTERQKLEFSPKLYFRCRSGSCHHWTVYRSFLLEQLDNALYYVQDPKYFGIQNLLMRIMKNIEYLRSGASELAAEGQAVSLPGNSIEWHWHLSEFYQSLLFIRCFRNILSKVWLSAL